MSSPAATVTKEQIESAARYHHERIKRDSDFDACAIFRPEARKLVPAIKALAATARRSGIASFTALETTRTFEVYALLDVLTDAGVTARVTDTPRGFYAVVVYVSAAVDASPPPRPQPKQHQRRWYERLFCKMVAEEPSPPSYPPVLMPGAEKKPPAEGA